MLVMTIQLTFTPEIQEALNYERYHHPVPLVQRRMEVLWLKSHGLAHELIACWRACPKIPCATISIYMLRAAWTN